MDEFRTHSSSQGRGEKQNDETSSTTDSSPREEKLKPIPTPRKTKSSRPPDSVTVYVMCSMVNKQISVHATGLLIFKLSFVVHRSFFHRFIHPSWSDASLLPLSFMCYYNL
ncbi:unnamed protein product [Onchocerca flexuosa]|uniref:Ovule protein n=1 Tax=Onchocerca flexuosa TaxID=387005 RepID=A0A183H0I6_9BILA|nr:unnamed protein product [Onchocerca flexuosa]